ncbi:hypothetical protein PRIPAC_85537 [Pristionchus pacificus]|uniref:Cytochrome P450 n=1 Tax=Pristionchus pacificus TaxID=54126 RepID=A0A2A6CEQ5_PRIPA|nr:hypothetical protein PRIPAC_85537 [Pristionchus pacificus]|eukprot:PDM76609.1 cytochrome P450 [Pristionchus pacificus]
MILELIIAGIVFIVAYGYLINRTRGLPPGPPPLPLLGNALSLGEPMDHTFLKWSKQYGPVFTVWMPGPVVVIADHQTLQDTIVKQGDLFGDRALPINQLKMLADGPYGLVFCGNDVWKEQRRFALHSLKDIGFLSASLQESAKTYAQQIVADWKKEGKEGRNVDVTENIMYGVANLIWQLTFGRTLGFKDPLFNKVEEIIHRMFELFVHPCVSFLDVFPLIAYLDPLFGYPIRRMCATSKESLEILQKELELTEKTLDVDEEPRCYADSYLIEMKRREAKGEPLGSFTRHQLNLAALDLWSAGFETTVTTLRFAVHFLMSNPDAQRKMQKEIDEEIGQRQISMEDQKALPYCMAAIHEIQRVGNIGEINFFRETTGEITIAGHKIPIGTAILPQFPSVHVDPEHFERPDYFCPERHINEAGEFVKDPRVTPFSFGKRACLGEGLARMELFIFLTTFVQHCTFSPTSMIPPKLECTRGLTRSPVHYKVKVTARF